MTKRKKKNRLLHWLSFLGLGVFLLQLPVLWSMAVAWPYRNLVQAECAQYQVDESLVLSVIFQESRFRQDALSSAGAVGLMQIMPQTATWIAQHMAVENFHLNQLKEPEANISMGTWYLSWLEKQFNGDRVLMLAAYNAGIGNVQRWLQEGIWDGSEETLEHIPYPETRQYVRRVLEQNQIYQKYNKSVRNA